MSNFTIQDIFLKYGDDYIEKQIAQKTDYYSNDIGLQIQQFENKNTEKKESR